MRKLKPREEVACNGHSLNFISILLLQVGKKWLKQKRENCCLTELKILSSSITFVQGFRKYHPDLTFQLCVPLCWLPSLGLRRPKPLHTRVRISGEEMPLVVS